MRAPGLIAVAFAIAALSLSVLGGVRHDYVYYLEQWQLVLNGLDPWRTNNAYGPLHNAFALMLPLHPLAPKILAALALALANVMLLLGLQRTRPAAEWLDIYLIAFGANALVLIAAFWFGNNDGVVAALVIGAVLARRDGRLVLAGVLLGLATLDKFYPLLLVPFLALDRRRFAPRLVLGALLTTALGLGLGALLWGNAMLEAVIFGVSRGPKLLSILTPLSAVAEELGIGRIAGILIRYNGPMVLVVAAGAFVLAWVRRDNWLVGATWGFFAVLLAYKVGHPQFWVTWLALVAALPLLGRADADRLARLSLPYAVFLALFQLGFVVLQPDYYRGANSWVGLYAGIPSFALGMALLVAFLARPAGVANAVSSSAVRPSS